MENVSDNATRRGTEAWVVGLVVLKKHDALDSGNSGPNGTDELTGRVSLRLISSDHSDPQNGKGVMGKPAYLEEVFTQFPTAPCETAYKVTFHWSISIGLPGAFTIRNEHSSHFYLRTLTIERIPGFGRVHFVCNSWVYPADKYQMDRLFFANKTYLPRQTPAPLMMYRQEELMTLRGDGTGELKEWDRVYDYDVYNDLGNPDVSEAYARPILGGSAQYPYPRRGRTGRPPTKTDPNSESRLPMELGMNIYVPRDERFSAEKSSHVSMLERLEAIFNANVEEFNSFKDVFKLFEVGIRAPDSAAFEKVKDEVSPDVLSELFSSEASQGVLKFPMPQVVEVDRSAWRTDEEFAREMLAGVNPVVIRRLQEFPPRSTLDPNTYGNQNSTITKGHIESSLEGLTVDEAIDRNRLFILDHHDGFMPYLGRINSTSSKVYATRTVLFLKEDGTLKPLAIELSLPHPQGDQFGAVSKVFLPAHEGVAGSIWELAKAYVAVNDSGFHQLISHFLNTHAIVEPYVIATNRNLSTLHPIYKLLHPHFKDTMNINALGRQTLINAGGILEDTFFPGKYSMELSTAVYKSWVFSEQALPTELIKRGVAVEDPNSNHGIRLLIEDYPYAVDGLEIWSAIKTWVEEYCHFYYHHDMMVLQDRELQLWWKEIVEIGHGDKNNNEGLLPIVSVKNLIDSCTIIIWIASALHAAVNYGQYSYGGYMPNRPSLSRKFMPEIGTADYEKLEEDPEKAFLETITTAIPALMGISTIEVLSSHTSDEVYLGQRESPEWTTDEVPLRSLQKFNKKLEEIEKRIVAMNGNPIWRNRVGPVKVPYTLLYRTSEPGLTGMGIPNSASI